MPSADEDAAILFTSGSTGPAKGVVYSRGRVGAQVALLRRGIGGPCTLVASPKLWKLLVRTVEGGTLKAAIENQIGGPVVFSEAVKGGLLVSRRGGDLELTIGQDMAIGYLNHDTKGVSLYFTESFTFRVIAPEAMVAFKV